MNVVVRPQLPVRNILSLCAGVGGLELGIHLALDALGEQGRGICYVEREAAAAASLVASMEAGWFHPAPVWSDMLIRELRFHQDKPRPERVRAAVRGVLGAVADLPAELMFEGDGE